RKAGHEVHRIVEQRQGLFEIDDVDASAGTEDVRCHAGIPVTGLMAEMDARFEHLAHGDLWHGGTPDLGQPHGFVWCAVVARGCDLHVSAVSDLRRGTPKTVTIRVRIWSNAGS